VTDGATWLKERLAAFGIRRLRLRGRGLASSHETGQEQNGWKHGVTEDLPFLIFRWLNWTDLQ